MPRKVSPAVVVATTWWRVSRRQGAWATAMAPVVVARMAATMASRATGSRFRVGSLFVSYRFDPALFVGAPSALAAAEVAVEGQDKRDDPVDPSSGFLAVRLDGADVVADVPLQL